ncbi:MAG: hypothetical protein ABIJ09_05750 [Pseudomonadota bacterium]
MSRILVVTLGLCCLAAPLRASFSTPTSGSTALLEAGTPSLALGFALGGTALQPRMGLRYDLGVNLLRADFGLTLRSFDTGTWYGQLHGELGPMLALGGLPALGVATGAAYLVGVRLGPVLLQLGPRAELASMLEPDSRWSLRASVLADAGVGVQSPAASVWIFTQAGYSLSDVGRGATTGRAGLALRVPIDM